MPIFNYECRKCGAKLRKLLTVEESKKVIACDKCNYVVYRIHTPPGAMVTEVLDNGVMPRAVERLADAERLNHERAKQAQERAVDDVFTKS